MTARVLVTGASGFIGRAMVPKLLAEGFDVRTASRLLSSITGAEAAVLPSPEATDDHFDRLVSDVDHIVHLAGIAHSGNAYGSRAYHEANTVLTQKLARAAKHSINGKFIFMSSVRAQCGPTCEHMVRASDRATPQDDYGRSKLAAEQAIAHAYGPDDPRFTILRPVLVYGPGVGGNLRALIRLARLPVPLPFASLQSRRSMLDRDALCEAVVHCLHESRTNGQTYLVADRTPISVADVLAAIRKGMGRDAALFSFPLPLMQIAATTTGQKQRWQAVTGELTADPSPLIETGWTPVSNTARNIAKAIETELART
ncbi:MAG: NAD-dependent epimerase/dehydratase family protein [Phyllobacterium sp.]